MTFWDDKNMSNDYVYKAIEIYDKNAKEYAQKTAHIPPEERGEFPNLVKPGGKILDAGCGPGRDCAYFLEKGFQVVGVDLSEKLLEISRKKAPRATFHKQDLRSLKFPHNSFDAIWACASLVHLKRFEVPKVLHDFYSSLKPGGVLFILLKEGKGEADVIDDLSSDSARHFTYFEQNELKQILLKEQFDVRNIYTYSEKDRKLEGRDVTWVSAFCYK